VTAALDKENLAVPRYNPAEIEPRWQRYWAENKTFKTPESVSDEKMYVLDMFPYPSGEGLHVGHPEGYTATDIVCRYKRMLGVSVLHPMGFDAFGLPAEEHAIKTGQHPRISTDRNIQTFRKQLQMLGFSYDWDRQIATTDVEYFRWTQWIFTVLYDTWFDAEQNQGRPISELPIPDSIQAQGERAVRLYQDDHRLAYESNAPVNWCPGLGTVLANEEVIDGRSERGEHPVQRVPLRQWMLRITAYADRLENDLENLNWSEGIKKLQRDWIGRSNGAEVNFFVGDQENFETWKDGQKTNGFSSDDHESVLRIYTTRPDTLFGATYMVIAPEHPLIEKLTTEDQKDAVEKYCQQASFKSDRERQDEKRNKTGVFTGSYAINPVNGKQLPVWIADYVLISYGTGAIMAVPAHDERDFEFAQQFGLEIIPVYEPQVNKKDKVDVAKVLAGEACFSGKGKAINSDQFDGLSTDDFKTKIIAELCQSGLGSSAVNYKLRDWLFSRQRFWGEPFPILHELDEDGNPTGLKRELTKDELPVNLPDLEDFQPPGRPVPLLEKADDKWLYPVIDGVKYKRETNTMPQWAGSCWYYLRFIDPTNTECFVDPEKEKQWMPVDLYIGGAEHAVLHLLYARFWHKVLFDRGFISTKEPFQKLVNQGMILGEMEFTGYRDKNEKWVSSELVTEDEDRNKVLKASAEKVYSISLEAAQVEKVGEHFVLISEPEIRIDNRSHKMSKSRGNVVNPEEIIIDYGADALRLYLMFMGPLEAQKPWNTSSVNGIKNFLDRAWRMIVDERDEKRVLNSAVSDTKATEEQLKVLHKTIKAVSTDIEALGFNTAIARLMEFVNFFTKETQRPKAIMEQFVLLLSPLAPHLAEELWNLFGHTDSVAYQSWPQFDDQYAIDQTIEIPVQINGKIRAKIQVARGLSKDELLSSAKSDSKIAEHLEGKTIRKEIAVPDRLVNFVVA
jgi:leucyl-tRNA synthetase